MTRVSANRPRSCTNFGSFCEGEWVIVNSGAGPISGQEGAWGRKTQRVNTVFVYHVYHE